MTETTIFLLLGSNLGDRFKNLMTAWDGIAREIGTVIATSAVYETEPWGKTNQPGFLNQAIQLESRWSPAELLEKILGLEKKMGRVRGEKWGERIIDIDIIYFGDQCIDTGELVIPHPRLSERRFVLVPLVEISPEFVHPVSGKSNAMLLGECKDSLEVSVFKP